MLQECLHTEVSKSGTEKYRCQLSFADFFLGKLRTCAIQKLNFFHQLLFLLRIHDLICMRIINIDLFDHTFLGTFLCIGEGKDFLCITVKNSSEFLTGTNRPVDRTSSNTKLFFDLIQKIKRIICISVHLIDKSKDRDVSHNTDFKKFTCLCLNTFGTIDDHDCGIRCHQCTVSILGEILMSRCIQNVDTISVIMELKYGRGDGNTSLLLDLHPV